MRKALCLVIALFASFAAAVTEHVFRADDSHADNFIRVDRLRLTDRHGRAFFVNGMNYWSCMNLAADQSAGGDHDRLMNDLDALQSANVNTIRIMASTAGAPTHQPFRIYPVMRASPTQWNEDVFVGLDRCIQAAGVRGMRVILVLDNTWQWTGGLAQLRSWANDDIAIPYPRAWNLSAPPRRDDGHPGWGQWADLHSEEFMIFQQAFYKDREAQTLYMQHLDRVMHRVNTVTGKRYVDDDTILAWEPLNEPQTDGDCSGDDAMISWHHNVSTYIKQQASKQLVTTGFEAKQGERCFKRLHSHATIDFGCAHIWTEIWGHYDMLDASDRSLSRAKQFAKAYLNDVERWSEEIGKPVLLEEFGMARDNWLNKGTMFAYHTNATTGHRDRYFGYLHDLVAKSFANGKPWIGLMPWSYGGSFRSDRQSFNSYGMLYAGDPPQEPPGWFSVLDKDPTMQLIKTWSKS